MPNTVYNYNEAAAEEISYLLEIVNGGEPNCELGAAIQAEAKRRLANASHKYTVTNSDELKSALIACGFCDKKLDLAVKSYLFPEGVYYTVWYDGSVNVNMVCA